MSTFERLPEVRRHRPSQVALSFAGLVSFVVAVVVAASANAAPTRTSGGTLRGAGSSFVAPLVAQWQGAYKAAEINYNPIGSGGGIAAISNRNVDFGASDAPLTPDQFRECKGCVQIPWALSATSIAYHLEGGPNRLRLSGRVLADIFLGRIKRWNDARIRALNKGRRIPGTAIAPVYRSDSSGTSFNFTDFLTKVSPSWRGKVGKGTAVNFPAGTGARGSSGVAAAVTRQDGAVTYVDIAYSLRNRLKVAAIQNTFGKFAYPGLRAIKAAGDVVERIPANNEVSIVAPPRSRGRDAKLAYPICTFTYVILPLKSSKAADLKRFVTWAATKGQQYGPRLLFQPIPKVIQRAAARTLKRVRG